MPFTKKIAYSPYHFTCYAALFWGTHAQRAGEIEVMEDALDFLSRPAPVAYNWFVMRIEFFWGIGTNPVSYEDTLKDPDYYNMRLAVHFRLRSVLVELLKTHTRPAENALDRVISRVACDAVSLGNKEILRLLLTEKDVDWDMCGPVGERLLVLVAGHKDEDSLRTLLQKESCSVNAITKYGSALHRATTRGHTSTARILLEAGADVNARDHYCQSVITAAIPHLTRSESWGEMMDLLLEFKADINAQTQTGTSALHITAGCSHYGTYEVEYLVSKGANVNLLDGQGRTPLDLAEGQRTSGFGDDEEVVAKIIQILREAGGKTARELIQLPGSLAAWEAKRATHKASIQDRWPQQLAPGTGQLQDESNSATPEKYPPRQINHHMSPVDCYESMHGLREPVLDWDPVSKVQFSMRRKIHPPSRQLTAPQ